MMMIAPLLAPDLDKDTRNRLKIRLSQEYGVSQRTLQRYCIRYRQEGFEGLMPRERNVTAHKISPELLEEAIRLRREVPGRSINTIIRILLNIDNVEDEGKFGVPMLSNKQHFGYLANGLKFLSDVRQTQPDWGLPELLMPSFEEVMKKSAKSFYGIDHQLFQEFYKDNVCGILLSRDCGTIVYGFGENTLYVWLFREDGGISNLYMYFYIESTKDNVRHIYTWPTLTEDDQLFADNKEEREQIYERLANKLMVYLAVKKYVKVETIIVPVGTTTKLDDKILGYKSREKVRNESGHEVIVMDSRWFRKIVNDNEIFVRGFFRFQNKKDENGEWYKELIFVDSFVRHGYHRNALIEEENNKEE